MKMKLHKKQEGYLALIAVLLISMIGFLGITLVQQSSVNITSGTHFQQSDKAFYIANAGLQKATRQLMFSALSGSLPKISCIGITGNSGLTNLAVGSGTVTASAAASPNYANTTLSTNITDTATSITVNSTSSFALSGEIMIDREMISYGGISGNTFIAVQRGIKQSTATTHASNAPVGQYQCTMNAVGYLPNATSPLYLRQVRESIALQEAWAVGDNAGSVFQITHWNRPTELSWNSASLSSASAVTLNAVSLLSNAEGWAVGNNISTTFSILHWTGSSWIVLNPASSCSNQNLASVSSVSSGEAWAVGNTYKASGVCTGNGGQRHYTILNWNGSTWSELAPPTIPANSGSNQDLNAVHVISTSGAAGTIGFAVGKSCKILQYSVLTSLWTDVSPSGPVFNFDLNGVFVVSASEAWAVGNSGNILRWNGSTWAIFYTLPAGNTLRSIRMLDLTGNGTAQLGWIVGDAGTILQYNGSSWSAVSSGTVADLYSVSVYPHISNDAWAAGTGGTILHWDGSSWSSVTSGVSANLRGISVVPVRQTPIAWQEIFP